MEYPQIITLSPNDWQRYKELRLRALKEEPQAFSSTYEEYVNRPDEYWIKRLEEVATKDTQWLVFARTGGKIVGMIAAFAEKEIDNAHVAATYVAPEVRGRGISKMLMNEMITRIKRNKNIRRITVDVNPDQKAAYNLYLNSGFSVTGNYNIVLGDGKEHNVISMEMDF